MRDAEPVETQKSGPRSGEHLSVELVDAQVSEGAQGHLGHQ